MPASAIDIVSAALFALALLHTFSTRQFERLAHRHPRHAGLFHLLGEVEIVFGLWAIVLVAGDGFMAGGAQALDYAESRNYTEPLFVFAVMVVAASRPILSATAALLGVTARRLPVSTPIAEVWLGLAPCRCWDR